MSCIDTSLRKVTYSPKVEPLLIFSIFGFDAINLLFILPGPNFNVTVGPNGSGKSSIVTALSICLGGDIKSLNRQSDIQSLVNHDTQNPTAEVEIELFFNKSENLVVRTVFGREQGSQTWMVNGKAKSRQV
jgi:chromosome segregation ATPase